MKKAWLFLKNEGEKDPDKNGLSFVNMWSGGTGRVAYSFFREDGYSWKRAQQSVN